MENLVCPEPSTMPVCYDFLETQEVKICIFDNLRDLDNLDNSFLKSHRNAKTGNAASCFFYAELADGSMIYIDVR